MNKGYMAPPIDVSLDSERQDCVVLDEHGVLHSSVLCDKHGNDAFLVAMCDFFDAIDTAQLAQYALPTRRWPVDKEQRGMITCLRCLGA